MCVAPCRLCPLTTNSESGRIGMISAILGDGESGLSAGREHYGDGETMGPTEFTARQIADAKSAAAALLDVERAKASVSIPDHTVFNRNLAKAEREAWSQQKGSTKPR